MKECNGKQKGMVIGWRSLIYKGIEMRLDKSELVCGASTKGDGVFHSPPNRIKRGQIRDQIISRFGNRREVENKVCSRQKHKWFSMAMVRRNDLHQRHVIRVNVSHAAETADDDAERKKTLRDENQKLTKITNEFRNLPMRDV